MTHLRLIMLKIVKVIGLSGGSMGFIMNEQFVVRELFAICLPHLHMYTQMKKNVINFNQRVTVSVTYIFCITRNQSFLF